MRYVAAVFLFLGLVTVAAARLLWYAVMALIFLAVAIGAASLITWLLILSTVIVFVWKLIARLRSSW